MAHVAGISVARLLQSKISRRYVFAFSPLKLSLLAFACLIAYVYGNFSQTAASPLRHHPTAIYNCGAPKDRTIMHSQQRDEAGRAAAKLRSLPFPSPERCHGSLTRN